MKESSNLCKIEIELFHANDKLNYDRLSKRLIFNCSKNNFCKDRRLFSDLGCTYNCLKNLSTFDKVDELVFKNEQFTIYFNKYQTEMLKELSDFLKNVKIIKLKPQMFNISCLKHKKCKNNHQIFLKRLFGIYPEGGLLKSNPLRAFIEIKNEIQVINSLTEYNRNCKKCLVPLLEALEKMIFSMEHLKCFKKYLSLTPLEKKEPLDIIYSRIFQYKIIKNQGKKTKTFETNQIIDSYLAGPYNVEIYEDQSNVEYFYKYSRSIRLDEKMDNLMNTNMIFNENIKFFRLNNLIKYKLQKTTNFLKLNYKNLSVNREKLAEILSFESIGLKKIIPFLLDEFVEEIFLDHPHSNIYLDHSKYGRCITPIIFDSNDIENFKTKIRLENNSLLDERHPFLKTDLKTDFFNVRVTCNIEPLAVNEISFSIRKLRKNVFSIIELIDLNTISLEAVAYLCFLLYHRRNILVIGAPGAGKTTLINSLDILSPPKWRKIYLEDVIESITQYKKHQVRFHVSSNSQENNFLSKKMQVRESLHRTPDFIFIGELIHKETVKAFFFLLKTGVRCGLGTCHGESPELIIQRWLEEDEISLNSIKNIDLIVQIAKTKSGRRVIRISELGNHKDNEIEIIDLYLRDPENDVIKPNFDSLEELYDKSIVLKKIKELLIEDLSLKKFVEEITTYEKFLNLLKNHEIHELDSLMSYINKFWVLKNKLESKSEFSFKKLKTQLISLFL